MRKTLALIVLAAGAALGPTVALAAGSTSCTTTGYTQNCGGCVVEGGSGSFVLHVPHSSVKFAGSGAAGAAGSKVCVKKTSPPKPSLGGIGVVVSASGPMTPLKSKGHTIYRFNKKTGKLKKVSAITRPGIYQIV